MSQDALTSKKMTPDSLIAIASALELFSNRGGLHANTLSAEMFWKAADALKEYAALLRTPPEATGPHIGMTEIRRYIQYWLDYNERTHIEEGLPVTGDTHVIPPYWPTRSSLQNWIAQIDDAMRPHEPNGSEK